MNNRRTSEHQTRVVELRRSNAAQRHVPKHRKGTRRARKNSAIREAREG